MRRASVQIFYNFQLGDDVLYSDVTGKSKFFITGGEERFRSSITTVPIEASAGETLDQIVTHYIKDIIHFPVRVGVRHSKGHNGVDSHLVIL